jgi:hypothetical protein
MKGAAAMGEANRTEPSATNRKPEARRTIRVPTAAAAVDDGLC